MGEMIFLDANAFYSYIGRKNVGLGESAHVKEKELRVYLDSIFDKMNITVRQSRQSGVARATCPD